ncbi:MAG: hypothetical protein DME37_06980, partial [Verrucomicrobia bacterium]
NPVFGMSRPPKKKSLIFILSLWQRERQTHRVANAKQLLSLLSHRSGLKARVDRKSGCRKKIAH